METACRFACRLNRICWLFSVHQGGWKFAVFGSKVFIGGDWNVELVDELGKGFKGRFAFG
jgi:hypothetical protein